MEVGGGEEFRFGACSGCINQTCYNAIVRKCSEFSMYVGTRDSLVFSDIEYRRNNSFVSTS